MATIAEPRHIVGGDDRFFLITAIAMALTMIAGFSLHLAAGRSSFGAPLLIHVHAVVFFGWVTLYVTQNALVASDRIGLHRRLGWIGAIWSAVMVVLGIATTVVMVRRGGAPFFFLPGHFLVMNSLVVLSFAGLTAAAIALRRRTEWHRRLHYCGMAALTAPAFGRLLPAPFLIPWVSWWVFAGVMIFPLVGVIADLRRTGRVHPAWWWGIGTLVVAQLAMDLIAASPLGLAIYQTVTAGSPGAAVAPFAYPPSPLP